MRDILDTNLVGRYTAIGVMSGSSLDGLDLAHCTFNLERGTWSFEVLKTTTVPYPTSFRQRLLTVMGGSALELAQLHRDLGNFIGTACAELLGGGDVDLIASHGHTIFHKPSEQLTTQIGCGASIAAISGMPVVCDFRTKDVAMGGHGAPLVPLGEKLLFPVHDSFLNLGGIANLSIHHGSTTGYDIGICNQALNHLAEEAGQDHDRDGALARSGSLNNELLHALNTLPFYAQNKPRSLGREWFNEHMVRLIDDRRIPLLDRLRTVTVHIATMVAGELNEQDPTTVFVTGGGTHNGFLLELIRSMTRVGMVVPDREVVDFKEALIFALLGVLRLRGETNSLASVTGGARDSIGGAIYLPN